MANTCSIGSSEGIYVVKTDDEELYYRLTDISRRVATNDEYKRADMPYNYLTTVSEIDEIKLQRQVEAGYRRAKAAQHFVEHAKQAGCSYILVEYTWKDEYDE